MIDRAKVIETFERIETERGGWHKVQAAEICAAVAAELGMTKEEVRDVMLDEWTARG